MPKFTQPRKTWQYTQEFKVKAVQLSLIEGLQGKEWHWSNFLKVSTPL